ncbi:MAG: hypothetical protein M1820_000235 [Bogoriella megaspora]|nr:MAG: hypothetical protein M1820_000235 [Bogoriella megaspora]
MAKSYVYVVSRKDLENDKDKKGRIALISVHGTLLSANSAAEAHLNSEKTKGGSEDDPEVKESESKDGRYTGHATIFGDKRHGFDVEVRKMELKDGQVSSADGAEGKAAPSKTAPSKTPAANNSKKRKPSGMLSLTVWQWYLPKTTKAKGHERELIGAPVEDNDDDDDDDDEDNDEEPIKPTKAAKGSSKGGAKAKKTNDDSNKPDPPQGSPDCLEGLAFVISGVLEGYTRDQAKALVVNHGGKTLSSISKNVDYVILGTNPGEKKLEQIEELELKTIDYDGFCELVKERSG